MVVTRVVAAGAALAALTIVAVAPVAYADTSNNRNNGDASLRIEPSQRSYHGGDVIKLDAKCDSNRADIAISAALDNVREWVRTGRRDFNLQATARVRNDVRSGNFDISFRCGDQKISVTINVDNGNRGGGNGGTSTTTTTTNTTTSTTVDTSTTMVMPVGAPQTGGLGPSDTGPGLVGLAELGGVVLVAGAGVGVAVTRRRRLAVQRG